MVGERTDHLMVLPLRACDTRGVTSGLLTFNPLPPGLGLRCLHSVGETPNVFFLSSILPAPRHQQFMEMSRTSCTAMDWGNLRKMPVSEYLQFMQV